MGIFKKDYIIGLDVGTSSVKIAQFAKKEDGLHLVKSDLKEIKEEKEAASAVKELFRGINVKKSKIIVSINCPKTAVKVTQAPYMPKAELREAINLEAKNYFPFPINDALLDFQILGDIVEKGIRKYEVAVSVSPKATIDRYLSLLQKVGIKPASFVSYAYAMQKLTERLDIEKEKTLCFVDIGEVNTELVIFKGKTPAFSRKIPVSGGDFTKVMTGVLASDRGKIELSPEEAEKIKREAGIPSEVESRIIEDKISATQMLSMLRAPLEQLVGEIERCFDYYREKSGGGKIDSVVLFGGGAALGGLVKFLSDGLGIEVKLGDAFFSIKADQAALKEKDKLSYRLNLAIGSALSEGKGLNLLPPEIKEETKRVVRRGTIEGIATAVILISALTYTGMKIQLVNFKKRITVANMELSSLQPELKKAGAYHLANIVLVDEPHWEDIFKELSHLIPREIHMTNISMSDKVIRMKGVVGSEGGEHILSDFILTLEKGIFKNVKLVRTKDLKGQRGSEFELKCWTD